MKKEKIVVLYSDAKREYFPTEQQFITEDEVKARAHVIEKYLVKLGFEVFVLPGNDTVFEYVKKIQPVTVFNLVDSIRGLEYLASTIPAALELVNIPYTGTGQLGLAISTNKFLTNKLLEQAGVMVPPYQLFGSWKDPLNETLHFPLISKLNSIHGSIEMGTNAICENEKSLRSRLKFLMNTYNDDVLVSEYIDGRELAAMIVEGNHKKVYVGEKVFDGIPKDEKYRVASFDLVWGEGNNRFHYEKFTSTAALRNLVKTAYSVLKINDYAKFDIRVTNDEKYYFIDANPNCALGPKEVECDIGTILSMYGISFEETLRRIMVSTVNSQRFGLGSGNHKM